MSHSQQLKRRCEKAHHWRLIDCPNSLSALLLAEQVEHAALFEEHLLVPFYLTLSRRSRQCACEARTCDHLPNA